MESLKCFPFFLIKINYEKIFEYLNMSQGSLSVYKKNLERMGIIDTQTRGIMVMRLPRFSDFIKFNIELE